MRMMRRCRSLGCISAALLLSKCTAFIISPETRTTGSSSIRRHDTFTSFLSGGGAQVVRTSSTAIRVATEENNSEVNGSSSAEHLFPNADFLEFVLSPHRPLGCTVEESLFDARHIFVTAVNTEGFSGRAGLLPGDVIVGITDLFGALTDVTGIGIDKVKGFVGSRPEDEPLQIRVARGTSVAVDHERTLIDMCSNPGSSDQETEQCVIDFLVGGYTLLDDDDEEITMCDEDDDTECLVDSLYSMWAEDLAPTNGPAAASDQSTQDKSPPESKVKPWSSRVSSSGTYVLDPATGKMKNIDA